MLGYDYEIVAFPFEERRKKERERDRIIDLSFLTSAGVLRGRSIEDWVYPGGLICGMDVMRWDSGAGGGIL